MATARSMDLVRALGGFSAKVEQRIPHSHRTRDLFGCLDMVAIGAAPPGRIAWESHEPMTPADMRELYALQGNPGRILGVQETTADHVAARRDKIEQEPRARAWLAAGGLLEVWGWRRAADGLWTVRRDVGRLEWP